MCLFYLVFEYVERGCVLEIPTTEPLKEPVAWNYFRDTVMGLEYCKTASPYEHTSYVMHISHFPVFSALSKDHP